MMVSFPSYHNKYYTSSLKLKVELYDSFKIFRFILGDQKDESAVLDWLLDADNRELDDAIESVNEKMLVKLLQTTQFMAVFFCKYNS